MGVAVIVLVLIVVVLVEVGGRMMFLCLCLLKEMCTTKRFSAASHTFCCPLAMRETLPLSLACLFVSLAAKWRVGEFATHHSGFSPKDT